MDNGQSKRVLDPSKVQPKVVVPTCHRTLTPIPVPVPQRMVDPVSKQVVEGVEVIPKIANFPCILESCTLYNRSLGRCMDIIAIEVGIRQAEAVEAVAGRLEVIEGLMRVGSSVPGGAA